MTGYGRGEAQNAHYKITIEVKSVNHRFLEVMLRLPRQLNPLEDALRKSVRERLLRGKADVFLTLEESETKNPALKVDNELALVYHNSLLQLAGFCNLPGEVELRTIASFPGVITAEKEEADLEALLPLAEEALRQALAALVEMRSIEGAGMARDFQNHLEDIRRALVKITGMAPGIVEEYKRKLRMRITELLEDVSVDEARFSNEVAFFADRSDISEELARLESHLEQFGQALNDQAAVGRRLEFILQEMNREINTIGSKANDLGLSQLVIDMKSSLEKMREQAQNVE